MRVALAQIKPTLSKKNLEKHIEILENLDSSNDLVIFPELSLNGYYLQDKVFEDAWQIEELSKIEQLSLKFDTVVGAVLKDRRRFYNSALYYSNGELLHTHRKRELPNYGLFEEARFFDSGKSLDHFETKFGRVALLICEDLWSGKIFGELAEIEPDLIIVISNSPARGFHDKGIEIVEQWKALLKSASILSKATTIFVNRVGFEDGLGFWGGSMIIDSRGNIIENLPLYEEEIKSFEILDLR